MKPLALALLSSLLLSACGGTTLASMCARTAQVQCRKLYECAPTAAASQGFTSEADCVTKTEGRIGCTQFEGVTCSNVDLGPYDRCLTDMDKLACTAQMQPASCMNLPAVNTASCTSSDGRVVCTSANATAGTGGCTLTRTGCSDGKAYSVACGAGTCTCSVNGQAGMTFSGSSCSDITGINTACGWNLR
ncbi:MAG: hypothetical protein AB1938_24215 [Myxococcota bacterium]